MLVLNDAQALIVEHLLTQMLVKDPYSVAALEEALTWFRRETQRVSCPFEQVWSHNLAQAIVRELRQQD